MEVLVNMKLISYESGLMISSSTLAELGNENALCKLGDMTELGQKWLEQLQASPLSLSAIPFLMIPLSGLHWKLQGHGKVLSISPKHLFTKCGGKLQCKFKSASTQLKTMIQSHLKLHFSFSHIHQAQERSLKGASEWRVKSIFIILATHLRGAKTPE